MSLVAGRFIGQSVPRKEDLRLLTGRSRFVDDLVVPGMLHSVFVRSEVARARLRSVDVTAARQAPGVVAVFLHDDLAPLILGSLQPSIYEDLGVKVPAAPKRPLANGDVRFVGEPIALVVAHTRADAKDAAELVAVDYDPLRAVVDYETAADRADLVHPELHSNVASHAASRPEGFDELLASATHVVTQTFHQNRQTNVPMECRGIIASFDPFERTLQLWPSSQSPHEVRRACARMLGLSDRAVRATQADVGGGFGQKFLFPMDEATVVLASVALGRPVKWIEERRENLIAANHARLDRVTATLALDADGRILAADVEHLEDCGALPNGGNGGAGLAVVTRYSGPYRVPALAYTTTSVWTNTCGRGAYRGPWMMETTAREQMIDYTARAIGMDPLELRRRNVLTAADQPYTTPAGSVVDMVSATECLDLAADLIDYEVFRKDQATATAQGRYLGLGLSLYIEPQGSVPALRMESATLRMNPDGSVDAYVGSGNHGQGLETTMAQVVAEHLGVHVDDVTIHQGDTESAPFGAGTGGSRSGPILSAAVRQASLDLRAKVERIGAHRLEAAPEDVVVEDGRVSVKGTPSKSVSLADVSRTAYVAPAGLPPGELPGLEVSSRYDVGRPVYSNACHACTVEIDPDTGRVTILRYVVAEDCGVMINPSIVEGQVTGGVIQGIGGALYEHFQYDANGNPLTTGLMDYTPPSATDVPVLEFGDVETPAATPGWHKGVGEGGAIGAPACVANAVADALRPFGVWPTRMPFTPAAVRELIAGSVGRAR